MPLLSASNGELHLTYDGNNIASRRLTPDGARLMAWDMYNHNVEMFMGSSSVDFPEENGAKEDFDVRTCINEEMKVIIKQSLDKRRDKYTEDIINIFKNMELVDSITTDDMTILRHNISDLLEEYHNGT